MKTLLTAAACAATVAALVTPTALAAAKTDVVFIGGTGTGMKLTEVFGTGGSPTGLTDPFVTDRDQLEVPIYDGAPWANPQASVPFVAQAVAKTDDPTVVIGLSKGAQVTHGVEAQDTRTDTRYVVIGDPDSDHGISRAFGLSPAQTVKTHDWEEIVAERDAVGDFPDRPWNLLATAESLASWAVVHPQYGAGGEADPLTRLDEAEVTETKNPNGTTFTKRVIPVRELSLLKPMRDTERTLTGHDRLTDEVERHLKPVVDRGWSRNDAKPAKADDADKTTTKESKTTTAKETKADRAEARTTKKESSTDE
ncbi:PE/PPE-like protein [Mycobacterium phage Julie1]|uniref:PE/PPE-like protein n=1 Tax=Mycobacterium phage Julie1 TaxID=1463812 RepID=W8EET6_9CAUD|nr:DNA binding protein [Mycobacterium phage Julie1]AHJ88590.1 PE/PPE-like protein [Mycobacterium phage Julie1]